MSAAATFLAGSIVGKLVLDKSGFTAGMSAVTKELKTAGGMSAQTATAFRGVGTAFTIAGAAIVGILGEMVKAAGEETKIERQLEAVLKSTGGAAGVTKDEMLKLADSMSRVTQFTHEEVQVAENLLLTFTKIGKDVMPQAVETVLDMSVALGQDLKSSSIQLGKALQDPILGMTALRRVGVNFDDEAKQLITTLVKQGRTLDAQKYILKELATEFGGSARIAVQGFGGQLGMLKKDLEETGEEIGKAVIPLLKDMLASIRPIVEKMRDWVEAHPELVRQIATLALKLGMAMLAIGPILIAIPKLVSLFGTLKIAILALSGPLGITIAAVGAAAAAINALTNKYKAKQDAEIAALVKTSNAMGDYNRIRTATIKAEIASQEEWRAIVHRFGNDYTKVMEAINTLPEYAGIKAKWEEMKIAQQKLGISTSALKGEFDGLVQELQDAKNAEEAWTKFMADMGIKTLEQKRDRIEEINRFMATLEGLYKSGKISEEDYNEAVSKTNKELDDLGFYAKTAVPPSRNLMDAVRLMPAVFDGAVYATKDLEEQIHDLSVEFKVSEATIIIGIYNIRRELLGLSGINLPPILTGEELEKATGSAETATRTIKGYFDGLYNDIASGWGSTIQKWLEGGTTLKDFLVSLWDTVKAGFFRMVGEMATEWMMGFVKKLIDGAADVGKGIVSSVGAVTGGLAKTAGSIASGLLSSLGSIGSIVSGITSVIELFKGPQKQTDVTYWLKMIKDNSQIIVNYMADTIVVATHNIEKTTWAIADKLDIEIDLLKALVSKAGVTVNVTVGSSGGTAKTTPTPGTKTIPTPGKTTPEPKTTVPTKTTPTKEIGFQTGFEGIIRRPVTVTMGEIPEYAFIQPLNKLKGSGKDITVINNISVKLDPMSDRQMMRQRFIPEFLAAMEANFMKSLVRQQIGA